MLEKNGYREKGIGYDVLNSNKRGDRMGKRVRLNEITDEEIEYKY